MAKFVECGDAVDAVREQFQLRFSKIGVVIEDCSRQKCLGESCRYIVTVEKPNSNCESLEALVNRFRASKPQGLLFVGLGEYDSGGIVVEFARNICTCQEPAFRSDAQFGAGLNLTYAFIYEPQYLSSLENFLGYHKGVTVFEGNGPNTNFSNFAEKWAEIKSASLPEPVQGPAEIEKLEEEKLKAKYSFGEGAGGVGRPGGHSAFLQKRLQKGQKFFDSGDYQMAKQKGGGIKQVFANKVTTGDAIPTPETIPARKTSIIQPNCNKFQASS